MTTEALWRVTYALPAHDRVIGVVRAATGRAAIDEIERQENALGRGPLIDGATDVEQVHETEEQ
ncbi:hypothetical protein E1211_17975 [Micromonospora sp. 15K316]|uniref:hypothetical protein n=1 Tax=Micromonospora sp. 15K316 TaxID=2530376 RepID=UPI001047CCDA|nr:hypothetical protein [Micromonospora sp. 15K316]TDC34235.1 hypothetical protein E1211_17975 [Micromonospora sp. 15K316]